MLKKILVDVGERIVETGAHDHAEKPHALNALWRQCPI